jgi:Ca2+-binding RTX toxin-like protein
MSSSQTHADTQLLDTTSNSNSSGSSASLAVMGSSLTLGIGAGLAQAQGRILASSSLLPFVGTDDDDVITIPGFTDDSLIGLGGQDTLSGGDGIDFIFGGIGDDLLHGGNQPDFLFGDAGNDTLNGGQSHDILFADNEGSIGGDAAHHVNLLLGLAGDDTLFGSLGRDSLDGGDGNDFLSLDATGDFLTGGADADIFQINLQRSTDAPERLFTADTIADFSSEQGDRLSFGLTGGMLHGIAGPVPLIWRGIMNTSTGVGFGLALPVGDLGTRFMQAWFVADESPQAEPGGWLTIDLDGDGLLGEQDFMLRMNMPLDQAMNLHLFVAAGSFGGIAGDARDDVLFALNEGSWIFGLGGSDVLLGAEGNDRLLGGAENDILSGGDGEDQIWGGAGDDWALGGAGNDAIYAEDFANSSAEDGSASNTLAGEAGDDSLFGGAGKDHLLGGSGHDLLYGGENTDTLQGDIGNDTLIGGEGDDFIVGGSGADSLDAGAGNDSVALGDNLDFLDGGDGHDWLVINQGAFVNLGATGNQLVNGAWAIGFEAVDGRGAGAAMTLLGGDGGNLLFSGAGNDLLQGQLGDDVLLSGAGHDTLGGGSGLNILEGGLGNDAYINVGADDLVIENPGEGADTIFASIDFYLPPGIEALILMESSQAIRGFGADGDELLVGNSQGNELVGGAGHDTLIGNAGADTMDGGEGSDWVVLASATMSVTIDLVAGSTHGAHGIDRLISIENVIAGAGHDSLLGDDLANGLSGGAGNDRLNGGNGNDTLDGGDGADIMWGGNGDDVFVVGDGDVFAEAGGQGIDLILLRRAVISLSGISVENVTGDMAGLAFSITGNTLANMLTGGSLADTLDGGSHHDMLVGGAGSDSLMGGSGNDRVDGGNDADTLSGGIGHDTLIGGTGLDWASYADLTATQAVTVNLVTGSATGAAGRDSLSGIEHIIGGAGNDRLLGDGLANRLMGGNGNDTLDGGAGADLMWGGNGDDVFIVGDGDVVYEASGEGVDLILLRRVAISLVGRHVENVKADLAGKAFVITGNMLANMLMGGSLADTLDGGGNHDTLVGGAGNDTLFGNTGNDRLDGGADADTLDGGTGSDVLLGGSGNDLLNGGADADTLSGGPGNDVLIGGTGLDWVSYAELTALQAVTVNLAAGSAMGAAGIDTLFEIENVIGGAGRDSLVGDGFANRLSGGAGNDRLNGGDGNDTLDGGDGADIMWGGNGNDVFIVGDGDLFAEASGQGTDLILLRRAAISLSGQHVENVTGDMAGLAFSITGNYLANMLTGGALADTLNGNFGNDTLNGGLGNDSLIGGAGYDQFIFNTALGETNIDTLYEYSATHDTILLENAIFTSLGRPGRLAAGAFNLGTAATDADDRIIYNTDTGALLYDADGVGGVAAVQFAQLTGVTGIISNTEFLII